MSKRHLAFAVVFVLITFVSTGCIISLGGDGRGSAAADPTIGQELIDLKKARDSGAISGEEYETQKKKLFSD